MSRGLPVMVTVAAALCLPACEPADNNQRLVGQLESDRVEISAEFGALPVGWKTSTARSPSTRATPRSVMA